MFKRVPDKRLNEVKGAGNGPKPCTCKCLCIEVCACDSTIPGDDAASYAVMVPASMGNTDTTNSANNDFRPNH